MPSIAVPPTTRKLTLSCGVIRCDSYEGVSARFALLRFEPSLTEPKPLKARRCFSPEMPTLPEETVA